MIIVKKAAPRPEMPKNPKPKKKIRTYSIPFKRVSEGVFVVEATDEKEALEKAKKLEGSYRPDPKKCKLTFDKNKIVIIIENE